MSRWRVDIVVQELDVPPEQARGIKFGDDVEAAGIMDFFERCRDAVRTLFNAHPKKSTLQELELEVEKLKAQAAKLKAQAAKRKAQMGMPAKPAPPPDAADTLDEAFLRIMQDKESPYR